MRLIRQSEGATDRGNHYRVQVWQNHHRAFEGHIFMDQDDQIFSTYDRWTQSEAIRDALKRAEEAGY